MWNASERKGGYLFIDSGNSANGHFLRILDGINSYVL